MFDLFKSSLPKDFFEGACDMHCHILPGVDDGFQTFDSALEALKVLENKGIKKMILTPHFMTDYGGNVKDTIIPKFDEFKQRLSGSCGLELHLAAEHMLDAGFMKHFERGFLTLDQVGEFVLCETSYIMYEHEMSQKLYNVMLVGKQPVIAHPERYQYASKTHYERWKEKGYLFQLNLLSLAGAYGDTAKVKSHDMLDKDMYDFVGSDMHRLDNFRKFLPHLKLHTKEIDKLHKLLENNERLFV